VARALPPASGKARVRKRRPLPAPALVEQHASCSIELSTASFSVERSPEVAARSLEVALALERRTRDLGERRRRREIEMGTRLLRCDHVVELRALPKGHAHMRTSERGGGSGWALRMRTC